MHFAHEEQVMRAAGYPDFPAHKGEHTALVKKVQEFQEKVAEGQATVTIELLEFVQNWLSGHILKEDRKYVPFVKGKAA
jgi:hemerythrin-like metal-binding protein